jgi:hypothetical protein
MRISLTDVQGREVWATAVQKYSSGRHVVELPMQQLASGTYFYRLSGADGGLLANGKVVKE